MSVALEIYNRLPARSRSIAASARGYYLSWWRYGKDTERFVDEAIERDNWDAVQWSEWQSNQLQLVLDRAFRQVPHYKELWANQPEHERKLAASLDAWPVLNKKQLREDPLSFVADDRRVSRMFHDHTSGTTGMSLDIWLTRATVKRWYALFEARCRRWYGVNRHDRWAILGGQLVVPVSQQKPPFWVWNAGLNQLYLSSYHLSPDLIDSYLDALVRYRVTYILGYPSAMYRLALRALHVGRKDIHLKVAVTNAEPVYDYQRPAIADAFHCPVRETYGMAELVAAGSECEAGSLHQWPEVGIIEVEKDGPDSSGEFTCTGLFNTDMPLIRYRVGDRGRLSDRKCSCGRGLPVIEKVEGRNDDVLFSRDGRVVGRLDPVFKADLRIEEAQIIQKSLSEIIVKVVPGEGFGLKQADLLTTRIQDRLGDVDVRLEEVASIARTSRGKFRAVICDLPVEVRRELENVRLGTA